MIKRELYLEKIRRLINTEPIKIITGVRRSGKTYLLHSIKEELIEQGISKENIFLISLNLKNTIKSKTSWNWMCASII